MPVTLLVTVAFSFYIVEWYSCGDWFSLPAWSLLFPCTATYIGQECVCVCVTSGLPLPVGSRAALYSGSNPKACTIVFGTSGSACCVHSCMSTEGVRLLLVAPRAICRVGQNCIYTPYMIVCMVISLPKIP